MNANLAGYRALDVSLGKLLITAAWVDGEVNDHEKACFRNLILKMPNICMDDWRKLKIYLAYPQSTQEQEYIVKEFCEKIFIEGHAELAWQKLFQVLKADGNINDAENDFVKFLQNDLDANVQGFLRALKFYLFRSSIENQNAWNAKSISRDKFIHEFFENPLYFLFRKALVHEDFTIPHSKPELQKVCLFASILSWIANEDGRISLDEEEMIFRILTETCGISQNIAECILKVAGLIDISDLEVEDLTQNLADSTQVGEREQFFLAISKLILLDRVISVRELECLRSIAVYLNIRKSLWQQTMAKINLKTTFLGA